MNKIILKTVNIGKIFKTNNKKIELFKNVNLSIKSGELIALVGPSGSGKTSLINLLSLIEKPSSGKIIFMDKDVINLSENEKNNIRQSNISIIFQNNNLLTDFTAYENIEMPLVIRGEKNYKNKEKIKKILKAVNLKERAEHFPSELSGGEQQRVAIARALVAETDLILADEPTGNLDFKTSQEIFSYFIKLKKLNKAIIFATHNRDLANKADYKLSISNGVIKRLNAK
jgi:ABC-type lipoprotein export system ATPase subunit